MKVRSLSTQVLAILLFALTLPTTHGAVLFQDDFETGSLSWNWSVSSTGDGRARVRADHGPSSGAWHLILDDSVDDALYSVSEATLHLNLQGKQNVVLSFKIKSLGDETHPLWNGTREFDGFSVSVDGGQTWERTSFDSGSDKWADRSIALDWVVLRTGQTYSSDVRIRFSQYDNASAPLDGIAIDDVVITADDVPPTVIFELPAQLVEGGPAATGYALLSFVPTNAFQLPLTFSPSNEVVGPAFVEFPAGKTYAAFSYQVANDHLANLTRAGRVTSKAPGLVAVDGEFVILDDEMPAVRLDFPARIAEGSGNATLLLTLDRAPDVPLSIDLLFTPSKLHVGSSVVFQPGQTNRTVVAEVLDDSLIQGDVRVSVLAVAAGRLIATNLLTITDNEARVLSIGAWGGNTVREGSSIGMFVSLSGTLETNLPVQLTVSDGVGVLVPETVIIPAGSDAEWFTMAVAENSTVEGTRTTTLTVSAPDFDGDSESVAILDNDVARYTFRPLPDLLDPHTPVPVQIDAVDADGNLLEAKGRIGTVALVLPDRSTIPLFSNAPLGTIVSPWTAIPPAWSNVVSTLLASNHPVRIRFCDDFGICSESKEISPMRVLAVPGEDLVWDSFGHRLIASVPASAHTNANCIVVVDPYSGLVMQRRLLGQNPGALAQSCDGTRIFAAQRGNGRVAMLQRETLETISSFPVGSDPQIGPLIPFDLLAPGGSPESIIVSYGPQDGGPFFGVARYTGGVRDGTNISGFWGPLGMEPSADDDVFFSFTTESSIGRVCNISLLPSGVHITREAILDTSYNPGIRSDGNSLFFARGLQVDGNTLQVVGRFPTNGTVCPDLAANRVFFAERSWASFDSIGAYDPLTKTRIRGMSIWPAPEQVKRLIRWGTNGLAFISNSNLFVINSTSLVPLQQHADLTVDVSASSPVIPVGSTIEYSVTLSNAGPEIAMEPTLRVELSTNASGVSADATSGTLHVQTNGYSLLLPTLNPGTSATLSILVPADTRGAFTLFAEVTANSTDTNSANNAGAMIVNAGFEPGPDGLNQFGLNSGNLLQDPARQLLWATVNPLGRPDAWIVAVDPKTGEFFQPVFLHQDAAVDCFALSDNGRYLFVGIQGLALIQRMDLHSGWTRLPIALQQNPWMSSQSPVDIEPLPGDGTSILLIASDFSAAVYDHATRRTNATMHYTVRNAERTSTPNVFVGADVYARRLVVDASGVSVLEPISIVRLENYSIHGSGDYLLAGNGTLIRSSNLSLHANFDFMGAPLVDAPANRAYLASAEHLRAYDLTDLVEAGDFPLPFQPVSSHRRVVRHGLDGVALLTVSGEIRLLRWPELIPRDRDQDGDGISDRWEARHFGSLAKGFNTDSDSDGLPDGLEYFFGTSPVAHDQSPISISQTQDSGQPVMRIVFPRLKELSPWLPAWESSTDLAHWNLISVVETVLSSEIIEATPVEWIEVLVPCTAPQPQFFRMKWSK